jgi:hypothetical protein
MTVKVTTDQNFTNGKPAPTFVTGQLSIPGLRNWDVTPDAKRFLVLQPVEDSKSTTHINIVLNWFEELKRLCPTGK